MAGFPPPITDFFMTLDPWNVDLAAEWASLTPKEQYWALFTLSSILEEVEAGTAPMPLEGGSRTLLMTYSRIARNHMMLKRLDFLERLATSKKSKSESRGHRFQGVYYFLACVTIVGSAIGTLLVHSGKVHAVDRWLGNPEQVVALQSSPSVTPPKPAESQSPVKPPKAE